MLTLKETYTEGVAPSQQQCWKVPVPLLSCKKISDWFLSYSTYNCYDCRKWNLGGSSEQWSWLKTCSHINLIDYHSLHIYSSHDWSSGQISLQMFSIHQAFGFLHKRRFMRKDGELWLKIMPLHLPHIQLTRNHHSCCARPSFQSRQLWCFRLY